MNFRLTPLFVHLHKLILNNTQELLIFFDHKGRIILCNSVAIRELGYSEDIYQHKIDEIFKNDFSYHYDTIEIKKAVDANPEHAIAYRKNMTCFPVDLKISIIDKKKRFVGLCTARNISEEKEMIQKIEQMKLDLEQINKARSDITANVTHELRTPVNGVMGLSNNLLDTELKPNQVEIVKMIKRCCSNMDAMINDLLDYAKLSNGKMILEQREFHFRDLINSVIEFNRPRINEKGLKLMTYVADEVPDIVVGDELRLTQILNNLLSNAVKFTILGQITLEIVKVNQTEKQVELFFMVIDTGIGISPEDKDKLFQSFTQVDGSITRRFGGTGLGLAISKQLVEAMGGTIGVDSEKDKGSRFSFSVRLGLPSSSEAGSNIVSMNNGLSYTDSETELSSSEISNIAHIDKLLREAGSIPRKNVVKTDTKKDLPTILKPMIEKLSICIEMENWDKAEELAEHIKKIIPEEESAIAKIVFRLLLTVRKENHDTAMAMINELKSFMEER